jgi:hypothetical protein
MKRRYSSEAVGIACPEDYTSTPVSEARTLDAATLEITECSATPLQTLA